MEKLNVRNMNSYMFNKIRMMAVACGIAIVSENYLCFGGGDSGSNPEGVNPPQGDHTNCMPTTEVQTKYIKKTNFLVRV